MDVDGNEHLVGNCSVLVSQPLVTSDNDRHVYEPTSPGVVVTTTSDGEEEPAQHARGRTLPELKLKCSDDRNNNNNNCKHSDSHSNSNNIGNKSCTEHNRLKQQDHQHNNSTIFKPRQRYQQHERPRQTTESQEPLQPAPKTLLINK